MIAEVCNFPKVVDLCSFLKEQMDDKKMSWIKHRNVPRACCGGYMLVPMVASQSKINFFTKLCFVCTGWCFSLLFMHFFQSFLNSNRLDNPSKCTVQDKISHKVTETGKGLKIKAKQLKQTCWPVKRFTIIYWILPRKIFTSLLCVNFANETRWYTNQEICTVHSSEVFNLFLLEKAWWCQE